MDKIRILDRLGPPECVVTPLQPKTDFAALTPAEKSAWEKARQEAMRPARFLNLDAIPVLMSPEQIEEMQNSPARLGVDLAKPGSDRMAVLMLGRERLELAYLPQPQVTLWPREVMLNAWARKARKSQKATRRQRRFAANKAKRLVMARVRRLEAAGLE